MILPHTLHSLITKISVYKWWNFLAENDSCKSRSIVSGQSAVHLGGFSASGQFEAAELILITTTKPLQRRPDQTQTHALSNGGQRTYEPRPCCHVPLSCLNPVVTQFYQLPASSCSNGYQSSIEHHVTTQDTLILGDFNAHNPSSYSRSTDTRGRRMAVVVVCHDQVRCQIIQSS